MRCKIFCVVIALLLSPVAMTAEESGGEEISPFSGQIADALWTVIAFVVLLLALWKLAWKPLLKALNARQQYIEKQISDAEHRRKEAEDVLVDYREKLANVKTEGEKIIAQHVKKAEQQGREVVARASEEAEVLKLKAETDIERARREAQSQLFSQAGDVVLKLGEKILGRSMDDGDHQKLFDDAIAELKLQEDGDK